MRTSVSTARFASHRIDYTTHSQISCLLEFHHFLELPQELEKRELLCRLHDLRFYHYLAT
jgi:hypothetical protein